MAEVGGVGADGCCLPRFSSHGGVRVRHTPQPGLPDLLVAASLAVSNPRSKALLHCRIPRPTARPVPHYRRSKTLRV